MLVFFSAKTLTECHDLKLIMLSVHKSNLFKIIINGCHVWRTNCLPFRGKWVHSRFLVGSLKLIMLSVNKSSLFKIIINVFSGVRGARSLVFCIVFCRLLFVCSFSFGHYTVYLWYLLTFLNP